MKRPSPLSREGLGPEPSDRYLQVRLVELLEEAREVGRSAGQAALQAGEELDASAARPGRDDLLTALQRTVPRAQSPTRRAALWVGSVLLVAAGLLLVEMAWLEGGAPGVLDWQRWLALALLGLASIIAVVSLTWLRQRATLDWFSPAPPHVLEASDGGESWDVPTFRVVALGLAGAGQSVLLASQAFELRPTPHRRYHLSSGLEQDLLLAQLYRQVRDTRAPWPNQIDFQREFLFDCKALDNARQQRTVFRISYRAHGGEMLQPGSDDITAGQLERSIDDAHALLLLVDGRRVLQLLHDERDGHDYFDGQLWPLLRLAHRASCPVQVIITKWDLVRSFGAPADDEELLRQVSKRLMAYPAIKQLVQTHCERQEEVRLIPVSAVGSQFAELYDDGTVAKRADGMLDPINVDVPLCAMIPDLLKRVERSLEPSVRRELDDAIDRAPDGDVASIAVSVLDSRVGMLLRNALAVVVGDAVVKLFVELLVRSKPQSAQPPRDNDGDQEAVTQRLRAEVIKDMEQVVDQFEDRLPSSILCRRR